MLQKYLLHAFLLVFLGFLLGINPLAAQKMTTVKGQVIDGETKEPVGFANVFFAGTTIGTTTDFDGNYSLESKDATDKIVVQFLGYESDTMAVKLGEKQTIDFTLGTSAVTLDVVEFVAKRTRYRKKNNPAVELIRKVIRNKKKNSLEDLSFYEYDKYEKVEMDLNNISDKFRKRKAFRKFQFIFDYVDTSEVNGKTFLPIYLQETSSTVYYRKSPSTKREHQEGIKLTQLEGAFDPKSMNAVMNKLYQNININDNNINFLTYQFVSPLSIIAPDFYRFYINDTIEYKGQQVIDLSFIPRNKLDLGFSGNMYITDDSIYQVVKIDMTVLDDINLNFVQDVKIEQEFTQVEGEWVLEKDFFLIDYALTKKGMGMFGRRSVVYDNFVFNTERDKSKYAGTEKVIVAEDAYEKEQSFWDTNRLDTLTEEEEGVYVMIDTLQRVPAFRRTVKALGLLVTGYTDLGPFDIGPVSSFYSFNEVEGFRLRLGGRTNLKFDQKIQLEGYAAYGFRDKLFKYYGSALYSFNDNFEEHPRHYIRASYMHETKFPGQILEYITEDNFLLSFKRGRQDNMMFFTSLKGDYYYETRNNITLRFGVENKDIEPHPGGSLEFTYFDQDRKILPQVSTTNVRASIRFSPNAQYFASKNFRYNIVNKYPVINFDYVLGIDGLGGDYDYHTTKLNIFKRFYLSILGYSNVEIEGGKLFGKGIPYVLMWLPRANQTFSYQNRAYNLMNYLEFISDEYVSINIRHYFQGFFFNKIPFLKKLKLREVATFKGLYGRLSDANNPMLDPSLVQFPTNAEGENLSATLQDRPYMEASVGISNIFKVLRFDLVKRLTYNDLPNVPELWGV
ncbi:MAG: DUF5686 family protein, partial [Bacteroidota bacterium]